jgi:DsbC/DsbD-like thiol-disulfide interchange protein
MLNQMRELQVVVVLWSLAWVAAAIAQSATDLPPSAPPRPGQPPGSTSPFSPVTPPSDQSGSKLVKMRMAADVVRIKPGEKFHLAFIFDIEPHWHIYWQNAGTSGAPTEIDVTAPPNFTVGKTLFPRPTLIETSEGPTYGYEKQTVLLVEVTPPREALSQLNFSAEANWLVCKEVCKMGSGSDTLSLPFGEVKIPSAQNEKVDPLVDEFKQCVPKPLSDLAGAEALFDGTMLVVSLPAQKFDSAQFFPDATPGVEYGEVTVERAGDRLNLTLPVEVKPNNATGKPLRIAGVVGLGKSPKDPCFEFEILLAADGRPRSD